jgi:hypothetical protein
MIGMPSITRPAGWVAAVEHGRLCARFDQLRIREAVDAGALRRASRFLGVPAGGDLSSMTKSLLQASAATWRPSWCAVVPPTRAAPAIRHHEIVLPVAVGSGSLSRAVSC